LRSRRRKVFRRRRRPSLSGRHVSRSPQLFTAFVTQLVHLTQGGEAQVHFVPPFSTKSSRSRKEVARVTVWSTGVVEFGMPLNWLLSAFCLPLLVPRPYKNVRMDGDPRKQDCCVVLYSRAGFVCMWVTRRDTRPSLGPEWPCKSYLPCVNGFNRTEPRRRAPGLVGQRATTRSKGGRMLHPLLKKTGSTSASQVCLKAVRKKQVGGKRRVK